MVIVTCGKNWEGEDCQYSIDNNLHKNLEHIKKIVTTKDFDFVMIVSGLPGLGKSNFAINIAKFFDYNFTEKNIAFTSDEFIELSNTLPRHSALILDESFASLNSKIGMSADFIRIVNHLQLIRQRNLFTILCLPNFFDLNKSIAIYRSSFLVVVYGKEFGDRGSFAIFGREEKKMLYILGQKYMNYQAVKPNFRGRFAKQKAISEEEYMETKLEHLTQQEKEKLQQIKKDTIVRNRLVFYLRNDENWKINKIIEISGLSKKTIYNILNEKRINPLI